MLLLVGAVPVEDLPLLVGPVAYNEKGITVDGYELAINRGNEAMMTSACITCRHYGVDAPIGLVAGDIGKRKGSEAIYNYLIEHLPEMGAKVMTLHYVMPDLKLNKKVLATIDTMEHKPMMIADAGSMYVAKAGGDSHYYDVFTPDLGEAAFLADDKADHPSFTRGFIFNMEEDVPELIRRAYAGNNATKTMFIKGAVDYVCQDGEIVDTIREPSIETMEPIGGTGDLITGMISGLLYAGVDPLQACRIAGRANRAAGELSQPTPATQVQEILRCLPRALDKVHKDLGL
ncbi:Carbohydrate kinase [Candidatus Electrothrix aarhusensis]|uniref:Carbohydrate kinase n=1 Tax=Candidatus Electrothrix aarhusensis TaxID=1859131 RepID=A0A3S3QY46_9BACT|nr:Carbohydrate kinase [Candidatus Electrothrix aarhusensis]